MIITAILTMIGVGCLFYGMMPFWLLIAMCIVLGAAFAILGSHRHEGFLTIDSVAQRSRLHKVSPALKLCSALLLMVLCLCSKNPLAGLFLAVVMLVLTVVVGGLELHDYLGMLALPVSFLMLSALALLFEYTKAPDGVINLSVFGGYLSVTRAAQTKAILIMSKAFGAVSCLYLLNLSTTMSEIIGVLRKAHIPEVLSELMYLIYRYIFIILSMHRTMKDAAASRLGYVDFRTRLRTTGSIYSNLLARSYRQANTNFDAMESRCFDGGICFLERKSNVNAVQIVVMLCIVASVAGMSFGLR